MKFILVVTDNHGKNLAFVSREMQTLSLAEATEAVRRRDVPGAYVVERKTGAYIRSKITVPKLEQFEKIAIPIKDLLLYVQGVRSVEKYNIDPYLLGAILIDEVAQLNPFEEIFDAFGVKIIGGNTSIGIAQVKTDTANNIIAQGLYSPNPNDPALPFKKLDKAAREHLYTYLIDPKHCVFFAGAYIRSIINYWAPNIDLTKRSDIIGTLYSQGYGKPKSNPETNERGTQIATEFYSLAKQWLTEV